MASHRMARPYGALQAELAALGVLAVARPRLDRAFGPCRTSNDDGKPERPVGVDGAVAYVPR